LTTTRRMDSLPHPEATSIRVPFVYSWLFIRGWLSRPWIRARVRWPPPRHTDSLPHPEATSIRSRPSPVDHSPRRTDSRAQPHGKTKTSEAISLGSL